MPCLSGVSKHSMMCSTTPSCSFPRVSSKLGLSRLRQASTVARARLPHMDEELEHMAWQLDKRANEGTAGHNNHAGSHRHNAHRQRLVFHDRSSSGSSSSRQGHHSRARQQKQHKHKIRGHDGGTGSDSSSSDEALTIALSDMAAQHASSAGSGQQQHTSLEASSDASGEQEFYCLQLGHPAARDLQKAQERMAKHMQQDGGCCVSAGVGQAGMLTHLLLLLQQKQLHRQTHDTLLLLQPFSCEPPTTAAAASTPAAAELHSSAFQQLAPAPHSNRAMLQAGIGNRSIACACPVDELRFFTSFMPLRTLLSLEAASVAGAPQGGTEGAHAAISGNSSHTAGLLVSASTLESVEASNVNQESSSSSLHSWSAADSSSDETAVQQHSRHKGSSSSSSSQLLRAAGSSGSSCTAALLSDAAARGCLRSMRVGPHASAADTAARVVTAVAAGEVLALHVKAQAAAHAVAYSALQVASSELHAVAGQHPLGFGVLLVQGHSHEHVHAMSHGHSSMADGQYVGGITQAGAASAAEAVLQHQHHTARVVTDASMDVGGFGAAFYGLGGYVGSNQQPQQAVLHKHGQEVWLCVVPLNIAA